MIIPKTVKIGGMTYAVRIADDWKDRNGVDGELCYQKPHGNILFIAKDLSREAKEITFIHEALHGMNSTVDHEFLDSLSEQIYQFFNDNGLFK